MNRSPERFPKGVLGMEAVILIVLLAVLVGCFCSEPPETDPIKILKAKQDEYLKEQGVSADKVYEWCIAPNKKFIRFVIDAKAKKLYISQNVEKVEFTCIPYAEILRFEIKTDGKVTGRIQRGKDDELQENIESGKKISSYKAVLYRKNVTAPHYTLNFIDYATTTDDKNFTAAAELNSNLFTTMYAIFHSDGE